MITYSGNARANIAAIDWRLNGAGSISASGTRGFLLRVCVGFSVVALDAVRAELLSRAVAGELARPDIVPWRMSKPSLKLAGFARYEISSTYSIISSHCWRSRSICHCKSAKRIGNLTMCVNF
jgi:hypothetical protein